jgi:ketosteroid isomerase-like protein
MKAILPIGFLLLTGVAFAANTTQQSEARAQLDQAYAAYVEAIIDADSATLAKLYTEDYTFTNGRGEFLSKEDRLQNVETGATDLESVKESDREVRIYGNTAIVTNQITLKAKYSGQPASGVYRHLSVWVKQGDSWHLAANQITPIVQ